MAYSGRHAPACTSCMESPPVTVIFSPVFSVSSNGPGDVSRFAGRHGGLQAVVEFFFHQAALHMNRARRLDGVILVGRSLPPCAIWPTVSCVRARSRRYRRLARMRLMSLPPITVLRSPSVLAGIRRTRLRCAGCVRHAARCARQPAPVLEHEGVGRGRRAVLRTAPGNRSGWLCPAESRAAVIGVVRAADDDDGPAARHEVHHHFVVDAVLMPPKPPPSGTETRTQHELFSSFLP